MDSRLYLLMSRNLVSECVLWDNDGCSAQLPLSLSSIRGLFPAYIAEDAFVLEIASIAEDSRMPLAQRIGQSLSLAFGTLIVNVYMLRQERTVLN